MLVARLMPVWCQQASAPLLSSRPFELLRMNLQRIGMFAIYYCIFVGQELVVVW